MPTSDMRERVRTLFATRKGSELIEAIADEIADLNAAVEHFSEQLKQLQLFQSFNEKLCLLQEVGSRHKFPGSARIDASQYLSPEEGFYALEYEQDGRPYRWTGPRPDFSFTVYVDRTVPLRLQLDVGYMVDPKVQADIAVVVDGAEVPLDMRPRKGGGGYSGEALIAPGENLRATNIVFVVPRVLPAKAASDARSLGVAFRELRVGPAHEHARLPARESGLQKAVPLLAGRDRPEAPKAEAVSASARSAAKPLRSTTT